MAANAEDQLSEAALKPQEVSGDAGKVKMPPIADVMAVADREAAKRAKSDPWFGIRSKKLNMPGSV